MFENPDAIFTLQDGLAIESVLSDLEGIGYEVGSFVIPACAVGAWHRRNRAFIVANTKCQRRRKRVASEQVLEKQGLQIESPRGFERYLGRSNLPASRFCGEDDGIPNRTHRTNALGNAVVPQVVEVIGRAIMATEDKE